MEDCDKRSKDILSSLLKQRGMTNVEDTYSFDEFAYVDIIATFKTKQYAFEVKERSYNHDHFGDIICQSDKYEKAKEDIRTGKFAAVYIVNIYADDYLAMAKITDRVDEQTKICQHTTMRDDHSLIEKKMSVFNQDLLWSFNDFGQYGYMFYKEK